MSTNFTGQTMLRGPVNLPGGISRWHVVFGFSGTASTYNFISPTKSVLDVSIKGAPLQITTGTTLDNIVLNNSLNTSGRYTLIANSTLSMDVLNPTVLQIQRSGTNNQDCVVVVTGG
jgi:hypothetical protein